MIRRIATLIIAAATLVVAGSAWAWACTPQANISPSIREGPAGTEVVLKGNSFVKGAPVEIHWQGVTGPLLATARGPEFEVPLTVPVDAQPGVNYLVALGATEYGVAKATGVFEVKPAAIRLAGLSSPNARWSSARAGADSRPSPTGGVPLGPGVALAIAAGAVGLFGAGSAVVVGRRRAVGARAATSGHPDNA